jgi:lipopolysaccharide export system permease protein
VTRLDRYVLLELAAPFLVGLVGMVLLFEGAVIFQMAQLAIDRALPAWIVARVMLGKAPMLLVQAAPFATLLATSLALGRLARESELTAMRAGGISLKRVLLPLGLFGAAAAGISFAVEERLAPPAEQTAMLLLRQAYLSQSVPTIEPSVFFRADRYAFYVSRATRLGRNELAVQDVLIYQMPDAGRFPSLIRAPTGRANGLQLLLRDGWVATFRADGRLGPDIAFRELRIDLARAIDSYWATRQSPDEMSAAQIRAQLQTPAGAGGPSARELMLTLHQKFSIPLACLVFSLLAGPLTLRFSRGGPFVGLLLSIVLGFLYYNSVLLTRQLGDWDLLPPALAAWSHVLVFGGVAAVLVATVE